MINFKKPVFLLALVFLPLMAMGQSRAMIERAENGDAESQYKVAMANLDYYGIPEDVEQTFTWLRLAAEQGHVEAQFQLAEFLSLDSSKWITTYDPQEAARLFNDLIARGDARTQAYVARYYLRGVGMTEVYGKDLVKARRLYRLAASQGVVEAQFRIGIMNEIGQGGEIDFAAAERWFRLAAAQGHKQAATFVALMYECCESPDTTLSDVEKALRRAAAAGETEALYNLGLLYLSRPSHQYNLPSFHWLMLAANAGYVDAKYGVAMMYARGDKDIYYDIERAAILLGEAAEAGSDDAAYTAGQLYGYDNGVDLDQEKAIYFHRLAALRGYIPSQSQLAFLLIGQGDAESVRQGIEWFTTAAESGFEPAQAELARIFIFEEITEANYPEALRWANRAARQGYSESQFILSLIYYYGLGVPEDLESAYKWARVAVMVSGYPKAQQIIELLVESMNAAQIEQAQALAQRCYDSDYFECGD